MTDTTTATRPVYADPRYNQRDPQLPYAEQEPSATRWDLAFGCAISVGPDGNGGPLRVSVHMSDREAAAGMCVREVTARQVRDYAHHLLRMVDAETGPLMCRTGMCYTRAVALVYGEPRCQSCVDTMNPDADQVAPLPSREQAEVTA